MPYKEGKKWRGVVTIDGHRYQKLCKTKRAALDWEKEKREGLAAETTKTATAFSTLFNKYIDHCQARYDPHTVNIKKKAIKRLRTYAGNLLVKDLTKDIISTHLTDQQQARGSGAANSDRKALNAMFNWAARILDLDHNPVQKIDKFPASRRYLHTPSEIDVLKCIAVTSGVDRVFLKFLINTGARRSEIFRLQWTDVNFERREVTLWTRKTHGGEWEGEAIPLNETIHNELLWLWNNRQFKDSEYVFVNHYRGRAGKPYTAGRQSFLEKVCKDAGVKRFTYNALRRYFASMITDKHKQSVKTTQQLLRHKNLSTTDIYIKNIGTDLRAAVELLDEGLQDGEDKKNENRP